LQTGIVEKLSAGTVDVLNVALEHADLLGKTGHRHGMFACKTSSIPRLISMGK
jgi:hypothetical protein